MNKHILLVIKWLDDNDSVTQKELDDNRTTTSAAADATAAAADAADAAANAAAAHAYAHAADAHAADAAARITERIKQRDDLLELLKEVK